MTRQLQVHLSLPHGLVVLGLSEIEIEGIIGIEPDRLKHVILSGERVKIPKVLFSACRQVQWEHGL